MSLDVTLRAMQMTDVYEANITHNLAEMAEVAGLYTYLWKPEEMGIAHAKDLIAPLASGLKLLKSAPEKFKALEPANGWGTYENFVSFVEHYLWACIDHPDAEIVVSR